MYTRQIATCMLGLHEGCTYIYTIYRYNFTACYTFGATSIEQKVLTSFLQLVWVNFLPLLLELKLKAKTVST